eukprot:3934372-Rhodomonas_salina.3
MEGRAGEGGGNGRTTARVLPCALRPAPCAPRLERRPQRTALSRRSHADPLAGAARLRGARVGARCTLRVVYSCTLSSRPLRPPRQCTAAASAWLVPPPPRPPLSPPTAPARLSAAHRHPLPPPPPPRAGLGRCVWRATRGGRKAGRRREGGREKEGKRSRGLEEAGLAGGLAAAEAADVLEALRARDLALSAQRLVAAAVHGPVRVLGRQRVHQLFAARTAHPSQRHTTTTPVRQSRVLSEPD